MNPEERYPAVLYSRIKSPIITFTAVYAGLLALANIISHFLHLQVPGGVNAGIIVCAVYAAAASFAHKNGRVADKGERRRLTWGSLASSYGISAIAFYILLKTNKSGMNLSEVITGAHIFLFVIALIIVTAVYYILLGALYLWFGKLAAKQMIAARG